MNEEVRLVGNGEHEEDIWQYSLRPKLFNEYVGQEEAKGNLNVYIQAAKQRGEALDHVLLYGPPGLGKTTLAGIIANELGVNFRITSGPAIEKSGDLAAILTNLDDHDVLFIDATKECIKVTNNNKLTDENIENIVKTFTDRKDIDYVSKLVSNKEIGENDYNLSVSTYVEKEDTREKIDIDVLNKEIDEIVKRESVLREEIKKIISEIEV